MTAIQERIIIFLGSALLAALVAVGLSGCSGPVTQAQVDSFNAQVQSLCGTAMSLAPLAGPMSVDIIAACGTADVVSDLATKPGAVTYLNTIIAKIPH
jgi:hypothetical protein